MMDGCDPEGCITGAGDKRMEDKSWKWGRMEASCEGGQGSEGAVASYMEWIGWLIVLLEKLGWWQIGWVGSGKGRWWETEYWGVWRRVEVELLGVGSGLVERAAEDSSWAIWGHKR
jgi:hypothetical protein